MSSGLIPASAMLFCCRPVVGPNIFNVPMPVSNSTSLSPVLTIGEFCSSTTLSGDRKLSLSIFLTSSSGTPIKVPLGGTKRQRAVGNHRDLGSPENEPMPIRRLCTKFGRARQRAAAEQGGGAQTGAERKQGPSRNILCHEFPPLFFMKMFVCARTNPSAAGSNGPRYAAPAFESWQAELARENRMTERRRRPIAARSGSVKVPIQFSNSQR